MTNCPVKYKLVTAVDNDKYPIVIDKSPKSDWDDACRSYLGDEWQKAEPDCSKVTKPRNGEKVSSSVCLYNVPTLNHAWVCKRTHCLGSPVSCCTTGKDPTNTCARDHIDVAAVCDPYMDKNASPDNISNTQYAKWYSRDPVTAGPVIGRVCSGILADPKSTQAQVNFCTKWCRYNPGLCDSGMIAYCRANKDFNNMVKNYKITGAGSGGFTDEQKARADEFITMCSCINSPLSTDETASAGLQAANRSIIRDYFAPECWDAKCKAGLTVQDSSFTATLGGGYKTKDMIKNGAGCSSVVNCNQYLLLDGQSKNVLLQNIKMIQDCNIMQTSQQDNNTTTSQQAANVENSNTVTQSSHNTSDLTNDNSGNSFKYIIDYTYIFYLFVFIIIASFTYLGIKKIKPTLYKAHN